MVQKNSILYHGRRGPTDDFATINTSHFCQKNKTKKTKKNVTPDAFLLELCPSFKILEGNRVNNSETHLFDEPCSASDSRSRGSGLTPGPATYFRFFFR